MYTVYGLYGTKRFKLKSVGLNIFKFKIIQTIGLYYYIVVIIIVYNINNRRAAVIYIYRHMMFPIFIDRDSMFLIFV